MTRSEKAARRAKGRDRRRAAESQPDQAESEDVDSGDGDRTRDAALNAARAAAAAAAVGAAAGAARALATRDRTEKHDHEEDANPEAADDAPGAADESEPADDADDEDGAEDEDDADEAPQVQEQRPEPVRRKTPQGAAPSQVRSAVTAAREQLHELHGSEPESVTALERTGDGWRVTLEAVEVHRVPESTDVLATYVVDLDGDENLVRYERVRRYYRAQADRERDS
jgi:hypothetical protein